MSGTTIQPNITFVVNEILNGNNVSEDDLKRWPEKERDNVKFIADAMAKFKTKNSVDFNNFKLTKISDFDNNYNKLAKGLQKQINLNFNKTNMILTSVLTSFKNPTNKMTYGEYIKFVLLLKYTIRPLVDGENDVPTNNTNRTKIMKYITQISKNIIKNGVNTTETPNNTMEKTAKGLINGKKNQLNAIMKAMGGKGINQSQMNAIMKAAGGKGINQSQLNEIMKAAGVNGKTKNQLNAIMKAVGGKGINQSQLNEMMKAAGVNGETKNQLNAIMKAVGGSGGGGNGNGEKNPWNTIKNAVDGSGGGGNDKKNPWNTIKNAVGESGGGGNDKKNPWNAMMKVVGG